MNEEQSQQDNDETTLSDVIRAIWDGKWIISSITAVIFIIVVTYLIIIPQTYRATIVIHPIQTYEISKYEEVNSLKLIKIDSEYLEQLFIDELMTYNVFEVSMMENRYIEKIKNETELDYLIRIKKAARVFSLSKPLNRGSRDLEKKTPKWTLSYKTLRPDLATKVIAEAFSLANNEVNAKVQKIIGRTVSSYLRLTENKLKDIDILDKVNLRNEKIKTQSRLAFLDEQNSIAKVLGIEKNTPTEQTFTAQSKLINLADKEVPFYLRGYRAIEKEIETLSSRKSPQLFIPEYLENNIEKALLLQDNTVVRLKESVSETPIGTDNFKAVFYDTNLIKFQRKAKHSLILALSIVLGGMIGIIVVCTQNAIIRKK